MPIHFQHEFQFNRNINEIHSRIVWRKKNEMNYPNSFPPCHTMILNNLPIRITAISEMKKNEQKQCTPRRTSWSEYKRNGNGKMVEVGKKRVAKKILAKKSHNWELTQNTLKKWLPSFSHIITFFYIYFQAFSYVFYKNCTYREKSSCVYVCILFLFLL